MSGLNAGESRVLVLDNYDSFTYNLVQHIGEMTAGRIEVFRNDGITVAQIADRAPTHLVISPGPCTPDEAGISVEAARRLAGRLPILGVCLGHQSIAQAFGGRVVRGALPMHGKTSAIRHDGRTIYRGIPNPFSATRYHSLVVDPELPAGLEATAWSEDGVLMGLRHREFAVEGLLFHPESILTEVGRDILGNFLALESPRWTARDEVRQETGWAGGIEEVTSP